MLGPAYLQFDGEGNLALVDAGLIVVKVWDPEGTPLESFGEKGQATGTLFAPTGVVATPDGGIVVASGLSPNIQKWDKERKFEWLLSGNTAEEAIEASSIRGMYMDGKNRLFMAGATSNQLAVFQLTDEMIKRD